MGQGDEPGSFRSGLIYWTDLNPLRKGRWPHLVVGALCRLRDKIHRRLRDVIKQ